MGVRNAARTLRLKTINKPVRVQRELRTRNRMRRPLSRTSRHRPRISRTQPARPLSKQRVLAHRAPSRVITVGKVAMSFPLAAQTLALRASATLVVASATWRATARLAPLKQRPRQATRARMPWPQMAKAPCKPSRPLLSPVCALPPHL